MEFCPKCGTMLVPTKIGRSKKLACPRCGYKGKVKKSNSYRISEKCKEPEEVPVIVEKKKKKKIQPEQEFELEPPEMEEEEEIYTGE
ncbi:MAG: hypothetical protein QXG10_04765 [Candidatus Hadarchaeales archaeon]